MNGLLVDTSVWVDLFRGKNTPSVIQFEMALKNRIDIYICGLIKTEILQGINSEGEYNKIKRVL
jgi:predicted nucleic acid-binding protein